MLRLRVANDSQDETVMPGEAVLVLGRAPGSDEACIIVNDAHVSRRQMRIECLPNGSVRVDNLGKEMILWGVAPFPRGESRSLALPVSLRVGHTEIELTSTSSASLGTIEAPLSMVQHESRSSLAALGESPSPQELARWFETLIAVQAAAASSTAFHEQTAHAVVDLVGLDRGVVLRRVGDGWDVLASHAREGMNAKDFSRTVLNEVLARRRTFFESPRGLDVAQSLASLECVVASPVLGPDGEVHGAVYGSRDLVRDPARVGISELEAQVVQMLAGAVSAGLARLDQEAEAARLRVQLEAFCSSAVAAELERNPRLLDATEREVSVLFADMRGFSTLSERLAARHVYEIVADVLDRLTECVLDAGGVVVDYYGDGLEAMWNAPLDQADHVERACRAALAMQGELPRLDERWGSRVGVPLRIGIGLNCGRALVGNAGSARRLKYGPRGKVVNLASRIEGATKALGARILASSAIAARAGGVGLRRMGAARLAGIEEIVELFALDAPGSTALSDAVHAEALAQYEAGNFDEAARLAARAVDLGCPALALIGEAARRGDPGRPPYDLSVRK